MLVAVAQRHTELLHKHQVDGADDEEEGQDVVPVQVCALEHDVGDDAEHGQRYALLYDLQLNEVEGTAILDKAQSVGRHLTAVFKKGDAPRKCDDTDEGPVVGDTVLLEFQMPIPSQRHEDVA